MTWAESSAKAPAREDSNRPVKARIESKSWCGSYAVASSKFQPAVVGAKSLNTAALKVGQAVSVAPKPLRPCSAVTILVQFPVRTGERSCANNS